MLGIDIGNYSVKAAVLGKGRKPQASQFFYEVLPESARDGAFGAELKQIVSTIIKKSRQTEVVFSISSSNAILKTIAMDKGLSGDSLESEIQLEMVNFIPFPLEQVYIDFVELGNSDEEGKKDVFVVAAKKDQVDKVAGLANAKSVKQKMVDLDVLAYSQVLELLKGKNYRDSYGIIDVGYQATKIFVFEQGALAYSRVQQIGGQQLTELISETYNLDSNEAEKRKISGDASDEFKHGVLAPYVDSLSEQVSLALELYSSAGNEGVDTFYLCGGGASVSNLVREFAENIPGYNFEALPLKDAVGINAKKAPAGLDVEQVALNCAISVGLGVAR